MTVLGTLSSVNLIAGAGILGNIGGVALAANVALGSNISTYTSTSPVSVFNSSSGGYVSINVVANTVPALTNAVPTAYQSNLGNSTLTSVVLSQTDSIMGSGDLGIFEQVLSAAQGFVSSTNQLIKSVVNANNATGFSGQDNIITGGLSQLTLAFSAFSDDLARSGNTINFSDLNNLGSPAALIQQIAVTSYSNPGLDTALLNAGVPQSKIDNLSTAQFTDSEQKFIYQAMTQITGPILNEILKQLSVTTPGINNLADLLNPVKLFPKSFNTFTTPTANGLRGIYIDASGSVNSALETELPSAVMNPLPSNTVPGISYIKLQQIIPADQALANKALVNALQQVKTIFDANYLGLSLATQTLETNKGLSLINALTSPLPANVYTYFTQTWTTGTGPDGIYLLTDVIGTPTGWITNDALSNTVAVLNSLSSLGAFNGLTNSATGVYTVMANTSAGNYTVCSTIDPGPPLVESCTTTIPGGLPGAGTYTANSSSASIQLAFDNGLIPAMLSEVGNIVANYSGQVQQLNNNWANISAQLDRVQQNLVLAGVDFGNIQANVQPIGLVYGLPGYGLDTAEGGSAYVIESLAQTANIGGQAIISTMREARNQVKLSSAGVETDITVSDVVAEPQATLSSGQYTPAEAAGQKII